MTAAKRAPTDDREQALIARLELLAREQLGRPIPKGLRERASGDMAIKVEDID